MKNQMYTLGLICVLFAGCKTLRTESVETVQIIQNSLNIPVQLDVFHGDKVSDRIHIEAKGSASRSYWYGEYMIPPNFDFCDSVRFTFGDTLTKIDVIDHYLDSVNILLDYNHVEENGTYTYTIDERDLNEAQ